MGQDFIGVRYDSAKWWEMVAAQRRGENPLPPASRSPQEPDIDSREESARMDAYEKGFGW